MPLSPRAAVTARTLLVAGALAAELTPGCARAQERRAPDDGGLTGSLGQPLNWHWQAGLGAGAFLEGPSKAVMVRAEGGVSRGVRSSLIGLLELGAEGYVGARGSRADGGLRGLLRLAYFGMGIGLDYNVRGGRTDMLVTAQTPVRRGGFLTRGTMLRLDWYPMQNHSFTIGVTAPIGDRLAGRNRPLADYVVVAERFPPPVRHAASDTTLRLALDSLRASAEWIRREVAPFLDHDGRDAQAAVARTRRYLDAIGAHLAGRSADAEVRFFHAQLLQAFTIASGSSALGERLAGGCRAILLDEVLLPYDRLLGRKKRDDTLRELAIAARGRFGRWIAGPAGVPETRREATLFAFQTVTDILEEVRRRAAREWDDPRLAWLPLQYALLPEDYDEQSELEALIERATGVAFTENHLSYVANLQFHHELLGMINGTRSYHVLWIHDFPAVSDGRLDPASFDQVVDGYLAALTARAKEYDSTGTLPSYFIFLDQHYYELRRSRILMTVLEDPLRAPPHLPFASADQNKRLSDALEHLRTAVEGSHVLQTAAREYGADWLHDRIKVHVNITNRADASFWSGGLVSTIFGYPDDVMRDHRKIAFRDVSESDPDGGRAILTGMGVGRQYIGPGWDDRSLIMEGRIVLELRGAARDLLLSQGLTEAELPLSFRNGSAAAPTSGPPAPPVDPSRYDARAAALMNGTGYLPKPLNVARALLYSLMPAGSVLKIPDSLWNAPFYGGLLVGACLRGAHVMIIAPSLANAPSSGFPQMTRAHELLTRLLVARRVLGDAITSSGGELRVGLYSLPADDSGFASRVLRWAGQPHDSTFPSSLLPFADSLRPVVADAARRLPRPDRASADTVPHLHQKVQFLATRDFWDAVTGSPELPRFFATYLRYRQATYSAEGALAPARALADTLEQIARLVLVQTQGSPRAAGFAMVGSQNQDYRGMFMDGEVAVLFSGAASLMPMIDLVFMAGIVTWIEDQETLDALLPPVGELRRRIARITKDGV